MTWRLRVNHVTRYRYAGVVTNSYNEARMTPQSLPGQTTVDARLEVQPGARAFRYWDYWGTLVHAFDVHQPHRELTVSASAVVETTAPDPLEHRLTWAQLAEDDCRDRWCEMVAPSLYVPVDDDLVAQAALLRSAPDPYTATLAANEFVHRNVSYRSGSTTVATSAPDAFRVGEGVCQDFAHIMLALLRAMGIPGRYVSGYLYPDAAAGLNEVHAGQSHAWVEAWLGDWLALDPTHGGSVGPQHVVVARGRDYADVAPMKGIFTGGPVQTLEVEVHLTRIA